MQRVDEKQTQCSESALTKLIQKGAELHFENISLWKKIGLVQLWFLLKTRATPFAQLTGASTFLYSYLGMKGHTHLLLSIFPFPAETLIFALSQMAICEWSRKACMLETVAAVISPFAVPRYVCGRCTPVSGKRVDQNTKKFFFCQ